MPSSHWLSKNCLLNKKAPRDTAGRSAAIFLAKSAGTEAACVSFLTLGLRLARALRAATLRRECALLRFCGPSRLIRCKSSRASEDFSFSSASRLQWRDRGRFSQPSLIPASRLNFPVAVYSQQSSESIRTSCRAAFLNHRFSCPGDRTYRPTAGQCYNPAQSCPLLPAFNSVLTKPARPSARAGWEKLSCLGGV